MNRLELLPDLPSHGPSEECRSLYARPADRCEAWTPEDPGFIARIGTAAEAAGLDVNLAVVLIVERALIEVELNLSVLAIERLDRLAEQTTVTMELAPSTADYLRALNPRSANPLRLSKAFRLPMRLSDRTLRQGLESLMRPEVLQSGTKWERAAVVSGHTMTEWALKAEGSCY